MSCATPVEDDGLVCGKVKSWAEEKYKVIGYYDTLFSTGMKNKWDKRIYIDLYSGSGYSKDETTGEISLGSPLIALDVADPFDKYIFCEENKKKLAALETRVKRHFPNANVAFVPGSCDDKVGDICKEIPKGSADNTVLSLCLVDPYDFGMKHRTLERLSRGHYIDFLVLLAAGMDANRNRDHYIDGDSQKLDEAFGNREWRDRLQAAGVRYKGFRAFAAKEFALSMEKLGFRPQGLERMRHMKVAENNMSLYYLALFSKNARADEFWDKALTYSSAQRLLNFG